MKRIVTSLLFVLLCAGSVFAQRAAGAKEQLELTTSVDGRRSCGPGDLNLDLRLRFRNTGGKPVILSKRIMMGRILVSSNLDDAAAKKYERSIRYSDHIGSDEAGFGFYPPADMSNFVTLGSGEVYEYQETVPVPTRFILPPSARPRPDLELAEGTHFLQVEVGTWPYVVDPGPIRQRWKGKGLLWTRALISAPMPFEVNKEEPGNRCPSD